MEKSLPVFSKKRGSVEKLCTAARLAEEFENLDFFIRPVNIQDADITKDNHDVNKFYADPTKAKKILGFFPKILIDEGIELAIRELKKIK